MFLKTKNESQPTSLRQLLTAHVSSVGTLLIENYQRSRRSLLAKESNKILYYAAL